MSVVGVDFGSKNAVIAAAGRGGVDVILNGNSNRLNPCMVGFDQSRSMGETASSTATSNYKNTIHSIKRLVGLTYDDPAAQAEMKLASFTCVPIPHPDGRSSTIGVKINFNSEEKVLSIESVAGMMVKHMGIISAEKSAASSSDENGADLKSLFPRDWVISVPAYYTDARKRAFLSGCEVMGVSGVQRLMQENTATALAYGIFKDIRKEFANKETPTHVMFIDLGESAYTVSIVDFVPGKLIVKSSHHDADLGGRDFDMKIAQWFANKFEEKFKGKLSAKPMSKPKLVLKLLAAAEKAKKTLSPSGVKEVRIQMECIMDDLDFGITLTAREYESMCKPLLDRLAAPVQRALEETKLTSKDLSSIELVGGGSRVGCVKRTLASILALDAKLTNNGLSTTMNADEAVARGCALQSAILSPRFKVLPYDIIEYQPFPVKISWDGEAENGQGVEVEGQADGSAMPTNSVVMFERGSNFPCVRRVTLRRAGEFIVSASYDDSAMNYLFPKGSSQEIATFSIKAPPGAENKIRVNVKQDVHGTISLSSAQLVEDIIEEEPEPSKDVEPAEGDAKKEVEKKKKIKKTNLDFTISRPIELTKSEFDAAFEAEVEMANVDRIVKETSDMRNELESYIYDMRDKIISDNYLKPFCTADEATTFSSSLEKTENWLYEDGFDAVKSVYAEKLGGLKKFGDPIVFREKESAARPNAIAVLQRTLEKYKNWLNSSATDEKYAHITDVEKTKCHTKCDEALGWMYDMLDKQGSLPPNVTPPVRVSQIYAKTKEVTNVVSPIMHKLVPKPKAEPKPVPKKDEKKADNDEAKPMEAEKVTPDSEGAEPMDTSS